MNERDIFIAVLQKESRAERQKYLDDVCGGDDTLRQNVSALLDVHDRAGSFLQEPAFVQLEAADGRSDAALAQLIASPRNEELLTDIQSETAHPEFLSLGFLSTAQEPDELGRLGHYRVLQLLGQGGMGMVFLADDTRLQRPVALKVMRPELAANPENRQRFLREGRAAAKICSSHVVSIYHVDQVDDLPYLVMEVLRGQSLAEALEKGQRLPLEQCLRIARETAEGLTDAHAAGLIHRDIKPGNIWLEEPNGRVKLLDFGLARARTGPLITQRHVILGTPAYMSPEQAAGQPLDERCDLFSLGAMLYHMLTGQRPFAGEDLLAVLMSLAKATIPPAATLVPGLPASVANLLDLLLANDPAGRPASAAEVVRILTALEQETAGLSTSTNQVTQPVRVETSPATSCPAVPPSRRRHRFVWAGGLVLAILAVLLVTLVSGAFRGRTDDGQDSAKVDPSTPPVPVDGTRTAARKTIPLPREFELTGHGPQVEAMAFTSDSKTLVSAGYGGEVIFWDVDRREKTSQISAAPFGQIRALAIDPRKRWLAIGQAIPDIRLFRFGEPLFVRLLKGHTDRVMQLVFLKDGRTLLSAGFDGTIRSWDVETQKEGKQLRAHGLRIDHLAIWEDGKGGLRLAFAGPNYVNVDDAQLERLPYQPLGIALSADGSRLACPARERGTAIWFPESRTRVGVIPDDQGAHGLEFTPDGKHIVVMGVGQTRVYEVDGGKPAASIEHPEKAISMTISPDGQWLAIGTLKGPIRVWHLPSLLAHPTS